MKCIVFQSEKMENIPIAECGGVILKPKAKLIVKEISALAMQRNYPKRLVQVGTCTMSSLRNGHYQLVDDIVEFDKPEPIKKEENPLKEVTTDRSMEGVGKEKTKKKVVSK